MAKAVKKATKKAAAKAPKKAAAKKAAAKPAKKAAAKKAAPKKAAAKPAKRAANTGLSAALTPSPALAQVVGSKPLPRTEIVKKTWDYIKKNGLQDKVNKRMINADDKLGAIFGGKSQISMFELAKVISKHVS